MPRKWENDSADAAHLDWGCSDVTSRSWKTAYRDWERLLNKAADKQLLARRATFESMLKDVIERMIRGLYDAFGRGAAAHAPAAN